jgi:3'(2'), 5'-bisphosphate nucleotidase
MVDPLDGTKEFIKKNGEFTDYIVLMEMGKLTFGELYVPVTDELYVGGVGSPDKKIDKGVATQLPRSLNKSLEFRQTYCCTKVVVSRSHLGSTTEKFLSECN